MPPARQAHGRRSTRGSPLRPHPALAVRGACDRSPGPVRLIVLRTVRPSESDKLPGRWTHRRAIHRRRRWPEAPNRAVPQTNCIYHIPNISPDASGPVGCTRAIQRLDQRSTVAVSFHDPSVTQVLEFRTGISLRSASGRRIPILVRHRRPVVAQPTTESTDPHAQSFIHPHRVDCSTPL